MASLLACLLLLPVFDQADSLTVHHDGHYLEIRGSNIPGGPIRLNYLEAYCRAGSTDADWVKHTVISHTCKRLAPPNDAKVIRLRDTLVDGLEVDHTITAHSDYVAFELLAKNPTTNRSEAHWAQPCVRLGPFTGYGGDFKGNLDDYLPKCFLFFEGKLTRMPTDNWNKKARYTPGQVWVPKGVPRDDANPRPLSDRVPSSGLIGCFSANEKQVLAMAWEPYQELFQGVARCLHSDFRLGGLEPGTVRKIKGRIYIVPNDIPALLKRYQADFPEHAP